jgi:hypothetical protein
MSSGAVADDTPLHNSDKEEVMEDRPNAIDSNHDLPARTIVDEELEPTQPSKEDPATMAASEELKHTSISDKDVSRDSRDGSTGRDTELVEEKVTSETMKSSTPETDHADARDEDMRERISSPKKKRGRDQDEDTKDAEDENGDDPTSSADGSVVNGSRTTRSEPEKKRRPRGTSEDFTKSAEKGGEPKVTMLPSAVSLYQPWISLMVHFHRWIQPTL